MSLKCPQCGVELTEALAKDIERTVLAELHTKHAADLERRDRENDEKLSKAIAEVEVKAQASASAKVEARLMEMQKENDEAKQDNKELREQLSHLMSELRESKRERDNAKLEMQKQLVEEEVRIREDAIKQADEKQRLNLAARDKTIADLKSALETAQRKASQGSQQLQGEVLELHLESLLQEAFPQDIIQPVAKGQPGGDIRQIVRSPKGFECGVILWETKRTKTWSDGWITKLKNDLRAEKANIAIIVTDATPKGMTRAMDMIDGIWVCKPDHAVPSAMLFRKGILDLGREKALAVHRDEKAGNLFKYVTSHGFVQQLEIMLEVHQTTLAQINTERIAYQKTWSQREEQAKRTLASLATMVGSMQGAIGHTAMPRIKGLEILELEEVNIPQALPASIQAAEEA